MDYGHDEDAEFAEAIRRSLLDAANSANDTRAQQQQQHQPAPQPPRPVATPARSLNPVELIDLTDDPEPEVKAEKMDYRDPWNNFDTSLDEEAIDDDLDYVKALHAASQAMRSQEAEAERNLTTAAGDDDEEDEELRRALALSLASSAASSSSSSALQEHQPTQQTNQPAAPQAIIEEKTVSAPLSVFGMSRAEMERERQERIKKRSLSEGAAVLRDSSEEREMKRRTLGHPASPTHNISNGSSSSRKFKAFAVPMASSTSTLAKAASAPLPTPRKAPSLSPSPAPSASSMSALSRTPSVYVEPRGPPPPPYDSVFPSSPSTSRASSSAAGTYPAKYTTATFRNTYIDGTTPGKWHVRFQDLVNKDHLMKAVITTMVMDEEWLDQYIPRSIAQCRVKHWNEDDEVRGFVQLGKVLYVHPPKAIMGSFHAKLMVLFYPHFCRIVISSANLVRHDWEQLVNTVYVQDFEHLPVESPERLGDFGLTLVNFMVAMRLPEKIHRAVKRVDFSPAKVVLIPAVQGWHRTSSLGKLSVKFLGEMYRASRGFEPRSRLKAEMEERIPPIKVVFPTANHVTNKTRLGELGAGTVCFRREYWNQATFPRVLMHDFECVGRHRGSLMHTKLILAKAAQPPQTIGRRAPPPPSDDPRKIAGWFYVGSANFTESAWGTLSNKRTKDLNGLCIYIRNWELGVVYMIETEEEMEAMNRMHRGSGRSSDDDPDQSFFGPLPVPYRRPLTPYAFEDEPWCEY
ncbi:hypothetical protein BGX23_010267 [Mortierella sp. AD031]|nr:hypothetical protein BGX23_010267 [Mortierella sp. AD031]